MKPCIACGQALAESVKICPSCGAEASDGPTHVDNYRILGVVHEGYASVLYRAVEEGEERPVALRLFTENSGVDEVVAGRLTEELEILRQLPEEWFVQHFSINCSAEGRWYRLSEWVDAESWGSLLSSGRLQDPLVAYELFYRLTAILSGLHQSGHFIPHLILNDILVLRGESDRVDVKIDYKLSRFLDPKMARPGPMLQNLLDCHPDTSGNRPLDFKSDIWSLGRIFTQVLSGDLDICDPRPTLSDSEFPEDLKVLIRSMLADDPGLRPGSMQEVQEALKRLQRERREGWDSGAPDTAGEVKRLRRTITIFGALAVILTVIAFIYFFIFDRSSEEAEATLETFAREYAGSIAFVMVQYRIRVDDMVVYSKVSEGTAFLVDEQGYLLTNRHVACPWLEDPTFFQMVQQVRQVGRRPVFDYRMFLWFEGERAFNRLTGFGAGEDLDDVYHLGSAYSRSGDSRVSIAGVARSSSSAGGRMRVLLQDDFAVLKINRVPPGLTVLPLARAFSTSELDRLAPVIALGFPLGNRTQADIINVSVTRGHIRRTFDAFFQVDTSIYKGNSGGPIIDESGSVIGIASAVATDVAVAPLPVITHLSDIGLVLPVTDAVLFLDQLKHGLPKWNGVVDLSADEKIRSVLELAREANWLGAVRRADQHLEESDEPALLLAAAVMHFSTDDPAGARRLLDHLLSIDAGNHQALLLRVVSRDPETRGWQGAHMQQLQALDWRSSGEFFGYLADMLMSLEFNEDWLGSWNNASEQSWIFFIAGLISQRSGDRERARELFLEAARVAADDEWPFYLTRASLSKDDGFRGEDLARFERELTTIEEDRRNRRDLIKPLTARFDDESDDSGARADTLLQIFGLQPDNKKLLAWAAYYSAMAQQWERSLQLADRYLSLSGREEPLRLGTGLLATLLLIHLERSDEVEARINVYCSTTDTPWYRQVCETLKGEISVNDLTGQGGGVPEKVLIANTYLGFMAEAEGNRDRAIHYYREALGSYRESWIEFELARNRYVTLRQQEKN